MTDKYFFVVTVLEIRIKLAIFWQRLTLEALRVVLYWTIPCRLEINVFFETWLCLMHYRSSHNVYFAFISLHSFCRKFCLKNHHQVGTYLCEKREIIVMKNSRLCEESGWAVGKVYAISLLYTQKNQINNLNNF